MNKLDLAIREIEYFESLNKSTLTEEELLDILIKNPNEIEDLENDGRYSDTIKKFKEGGLL